MNSMDKVINACKDMEPIDGLMLNEVEARGIELTSLQSIAISLKRIADKLELSQKQPIMMNAEEALKFYKDRYGC